MTSVENLIREQLAYHGIVDVPPYAQREIAWISGTGPAPGREDDPRGPAVGAVMAERLLAGELEIVGIDRTGKLVFTGAGRALRPSRRDRRRDARSGRRRS